MIADGLELVASRYTALKRGIALVVAAVIVLACTHSCAYFKGRDGEAQRAAAKQLQALQAQHGAYAAELVRRDGIERELGRLLNEQGARADALFLKLNQEVSRVTVKYIDRPGAAAQPLPHCIFTAGFERVWNEALTGALPAAAPAAAGTDAADPAAAAADLLATDLTQADVLGNHVGNAQRCDDITRQLGGLMAWNERIARGAP